MIELDIFLVTTIKKKILILKNVKGILDTLKFEIITR